MLKKILKGKNIKKHERIYKDDEILNSRINDCYQEYLLKFIEFFLKKSYSGSIKEISSKNDSKT
jgi:hypothetical protein